MVRRLCGELSSLLLVAWRNSDGGSCLEKGSWLRPAPTGLLCGYTGREKGLKGNRNQRNSLSTMEHGKVGDWGRPVSISREFGKSIEWLLTG